MKMLNKKIMMVLCSLALIGNALIAQDVAKYVGPVSCKLCHNNPAKGEQYNKWQATAHSTAFATLSGAKAMEYGKNNGIADPSKEAKCLKCHSTAANVDKNIVGGLKNEDGVSCESCHGPGSLYKAMNIMKDTAVAKTKGLLVPTEKTCLQCHIQEGNPFYKPFDFATFDAKIAHKYPPKK